MVLTVAENGSWDAAKTSIKRDYPCSVGVASGFAGEYNNYGSHWMTVVSVSKTSAGTKYYHVNCGWGSNGGNHDGYDKLNANGANIGRVYSLKDI